MPEWGLINKFYLCKNKKNDEQNLVTDVLPFIVFRC